MSKKRNKQKKKKNNRPRKVVSKKTTNLVYYEYTITDEPINLHKIPAEIENDVEELYFEIQHRPKDTINRLETLLENFPNIPQLYNYLSIAYSMVGDNKKAEEIIKNSFRENPDYLFGRINYAEICINKGDLHKIPEIFNNTYELKMLYPERDVFHVSEVVGFFGVTGLYFNAIGNNEQANVCLKTLKRLSPEHPFTNKLDKQIMLSSLKNKCLNLFK